MSNLSRRIIMVLNILIFSTFALGQNEGIVSREGNQFILNGSPFYYAGSNNYYQMVYAADPGLRYAVDEVQEEMAAMGMTVLRTWAFNDGSSQWNALQTSPGVYQEYVFQGLDYVLFKADLEGLRVILPLVNNWDDYGGMNQYVDWSDEYSGPCIGFVQTNGTHFELNGKLYYYVGANFWCALNLASNGAGGNRARLLRELDNLKAKGINNLRIMAGTEGADTEPWRMVPSLQTSPGVYNPEVLDGLDYLLCAMKERGLRAVMALNNFWQWSGGMAQYVNWNGGGPIPYPPPQQGGSWDEFQDYASDFYSNQGAMDDFNNHINFIINRVNPHTGIAYKDEPAIFAWELGNEPRGWHNNITDFNLWIDNTAAYIKSLDTNHLVTTGCEGDTPWPTWNGLDFMENHNGADIDYTTIHIWPQNWGWYDPGNPGGTYASAEANARSYFNDHEAEAVILGKPMVLEEFGLARDGGSYDPSSLTTYRDLFYGAMYEEVYNSASTNGPGAGDNFWAWSGEGRPLEPYGSYWNPGDPWIGDPPHEHQGWYSVYDADSTTLEVITSHAAQMQALIPSGSHDDFYTNEVCKELYKNHIETVLNRVNTFNGRLYREDSTVFAWELANEPECTSDPSGDILQAWIEEMSAYIKSLDSLHMVTTGSEGFYGPTGPAHNPAGWMGQKGVDFIRNHQPADIDFACAHLWPDSWGMSFTSSVDWVTNHILDTETLLGKPVILEEYGRYQPLTTRNQYFQAWLDGIYAGALTGEAAAGSNLWILYHDDYPDYDGFGVYYPAHVSTVSLLESHAADMNRLTEAYASHTKGVKISSQVDTGGDETIVDEWNIASLDSGATDDYDAGFDIPEPSPPTSGYVSTYFPHPEWVSPVGDDFRIDIRNGNDDLTNAVKIFLFQVETDLTGETVELNFTIGSEYSGDLGVVLYDREEEVYRNVREDSVYSFTADSNPHSFDLRLGDSTPPEINIIFPTPDTLLYGGNIYILTWEIIDVSPIRYQMVYYSLDNGVNWTLIDSISGGEQTWYSWTVTDTVADSTRIKVEAEDWAGNFGSEVTGYTFSIGDGRMEHHFDSGWHMMSVPLLPQHTSIDSIFGDDVNGTYFVFDYSQSTGYYLVEEVEHGSGYWLVLEDSTTIDVVGTSAEDSTCLPLNLNWNIVGAAMTSAVPVDSLRFSDGETVYPFAQAVNEGWISPALFLYNNANGTYETIDTFEPWGGYWLQTLMANIQMITHPPHSDEGFYLADGRRDEESGEEFDWFVPIFVSQGESVNKLAGLGAHWEAVDGYDVWFDFPTPPVSPDGDFVQVVFQRPEWNSPTGDIFIRDIRAPFENEVEIQIESWDFTLEASEPGEIIVNFPQIEKRLPAGYSAKLHYDDISVNLLERNTFAIAYTEPLNASVIVFNRAAATAGRSCAAGSMNIPRTYAIGSIYPNPFNSSAIIQIGLPEASELRVHAYNGLGQKVASITQGYYSAGYHNIVFEADDLSSGMYFINVMVPGRLDKMRKIILIR